MKAVIVYQSAYGHVEKMAEKIKAGLEDSGVKTTLSKATKTDPNSLLEYDAILLGSPVRMGSIGDEMKTFIDTTGQIWMESKLQNRIGGVFVSGGGRNSGSELTQISLYSTLFELGLIPVGFVNDMPGFGAGANQWGPYASVGLDGSEGPSDECLTACFEYGKRVGNYTKIIRNKG